MPALLPVLEDENKIIQACQHGEINGFRKIYECYGQPLLRTALRLLSQQQDAEDAVQMTFIKLFQNIKAFHFQSKLSTYLFRIHTNVCFDLLRKRKHLPDQSLDEISTSYQSNPGVKIDLENAIAELPEKMRVCFILFAIEGLKQTEIAAILNLQLGTVKSNIFHAKTKLKMWLK